MVICPSRGADSHMSQQMPLPHCHCSCVSEIHIGSTFLVPAHPGSPGRRAVKWVLLLMLHNYCVHYTYGYAHVRYVDISLHHNVTGHVKHIL